MSQNRILKEATVDPGVIRYNLLAGTIVLTLTIVGIPLLLIFLPIANWYWTRYYKRLKVVLTTRELKVHRGILIREEKSIPLEKITDLAVFEGPIMRYLGLKGIRVETAGQSSAAGRALVQIIGLHETIAFRDMVLAQRDHIADRDLTPAASPRDALAADNSSATLAALEDIRDTLHRIESRLPADRAAHGD